MGPYRSWEYQWRSSIYHRAKILLLKQGRWVQNMLHLQCLFRSEVHVLTAYWAVEIFAHTILTLIFHNFISFKSVCPSGWKEFRDNCYGFVPRYMSFTKAKQFCVARKVKIVLLDWKAAWSILVCICLSSLGNCALLRCFRNYQPFIKYFSGETKFLQISRRKKICRSQCTTQKNTTNMELCSNKEFERKRICKLFLARWECMGLQ